MLEHVSAPVTKSILGGIVVSSTIVSTMKIGEVLHACLVPRLWGVWDSYLSLSWQLAFATPGELLFGIFALHRMCAVERVMGIRRFAAFLTTAFSLTSFMVPAAMRLLCIFPAFQFAGQALHLGLTPTIFAVLYQHHALIPSKMFLALPMGEADSQNETHRSEQLPIITNNFWLYIAVAQLATCEVPITIVSAAAGWIVGAAYHKHPLFKSWRLPRVLTSFIDGSAHRRNIQQRKRIVPGDTFGTDMRTPEFEQIQAGQQPAELDIQQLMTVMNLSHEVAAQALSAANNSMEQAIENLLVT